ncbi:putative WD40-repeat-containing domain superfamily [Plasmopara halstedii]
MRLRYLALFFSLLRGFSIWGSALKGRSATDVKAFNHVLRAEIEAVRQQLKLYRQKANYLSSAIYQFQSLNETIDLSGSMLNVSAKKFHSKPLKNPKLLSNWFEPQGTFRLINSTQVLTQLISFRPTISKRAHKRSRHKKSTNDEPPLQFLLVVDRYSTVMKLIHPITFELMWQHALNLRSLSTDEEFHIADIYFVSDRRSYLVILSTLGDVVLFKLRLWYGRRIIAGDVRHFDTRQVQDQSKLQCLKGQDMIDLFCESKPPWVRSSLTVPSFGKYLHVDVERIFAATLSPQWDYDHGKVAVVTFYHHMSVVAADNSGRHLSFYHGNGSFIKDLHTQKEIHGSSMVQLGHLQSGKGLIAVATQYQIKFVDASSLHMVPVVCEAPGPHTFSSVAVDPLHQTTFYAGTSTGRVFVFELHNLGGWRQQVKAHNPLVCTLVKQLMPRLPYRLDFGLNLPVIVKTMPRYLLMGAGSHLLLYQLSSSSEKAQAIYLSGSSLDDSLQMLDMSVANDLITHTIGFVILASDINESCRLDIYESRITPHDINFDLSWIRLPAMMICAVAAIYWQRKGRPGRRNMFDEAELTSLLSSRNGQWSSSRMMNRGGMTMDTKAKYWQ